MSFCAQVDAKDQDNDPIASPIQVIPPEEDEAKDDKLQHTEIEKWNEQETVRFNLDLSPVTTHKVQLSPKPNKNSDTLGTSPQTFNMDMMKPYFRWQYKHCYSF